MGKVCNLGNKNLDLRKGEKELNGDFNVPYCREPRPKGMGDTILMKTLTNWRKKKSLGSSDGSRKDDWEGISGMGT